MSAGDLGAGGGDHGRWAESLAAYALGALDAGEAAELEEHLVGCERCRAELDWLAPAVDLLPGSVEQREPPESLRRELMATVRAEAAEEGRREAVSGFAAGAGGHAGPGRVEGARRGTAQRAASRWLGSLLGLRPGLALILVAAVAAAGLAGYTLRGPGTDRVVVAFEAAAAAAGGAGGTLTEYEDGPTTMELTGLPVLENDSVYQAWLRYDEVLVPSSVFVVDHQGKGTATIPEGLDDVDEVLITHEPPGGSRVPTTDPFLGADPGQA